MSTLEKDMNTTDSDFEDQNCLIRLLLILNPFALLFYFMWIVHLISHPVNTLVKILKETTSDSQRMR